MRTVHNLNENGAGIVSLKIFNGYVDQNKKIPPYVHFRCGRVHINKSLRKIGESYKFQKSLHKKELEHDEIYENTWEVKKKSGYLMLRTRGYQLLSVKLDIQWVWKIVWLYPV